MQNKVNIVGISNLTPDSFSDGGKYKNPDDAVADINKMFEQGATWVDIGGESTKPGATPVEISEEWGRVEPVLGPAIAGYTGSISVDTRHPEIIRMAAQFGSVIINDVTNFSDPEMIEVAAELGFTCVVSHLPDSAGGDIQKAHDEKDITSVQQVLDQQMSRAEAMVAAGISLGNIILDPGFGFGKPYRVNMELINYAELVDGFEVFLGISRKSSLITDPNTGTIPESILEMNKEDRNALLDELSVQFGLEAARSGAKHLRVHNVGMHAKALVDAGFY